ncbi:MAG: CoB--CoM heterodisulfide reductase iron-sulfur subunit B family protein [Candidatus Aminicenantes bacterium]|nr:CoB--CoM heterodisulfide reductase iron-sulfur subunit B family protein [Candidatus Aminicenantes bacterium]
MKLTYYPGCTLKNHAKNFEDSALCSLKNLGVEVEELKRWNCCGTVFSLSTDDLIHHLAPIRNLIRVKEADSNQVMTLCAICYNTLKRANLRMKENPDDLNTVNELMYEEEVKYQGDVNVFHLLEYLKNELSFAKIATQVKKPLKNLKVASYYGCYLVRPKNVGFDDPENPTIMDDLMASLGATPIDFPYKTECCGAYQTVDKPEIIAQRTYQIVKSAQQQGAEVIAVSCPLCAYNLDQRQKQTLEIYSDFINIPILYFSQFMAIALGCPEEALRFDLHYIDPKPILREKGLI